MVTAMPQAMKPIRVMIIDDHEMVRTALRMLIESHPNLTVVGEACSRATAIPSVRSEQPDIILLDLDLGGENGVDLIPELLAIAKDARVLVLTGVSDVEIHNRALLAGAVGLLLKEKSGDVLVKAITKVHTGEAWLDRFTMAAVLSEFSHKKDAKKTNPEAMKIAALSPREREAISLVAEGLQNQQIGERLHVSESTVRHHLTSIFGKLDVSNRFELIIYAFRHCLANSQDP